MSQEIHSKLNQKKTFNLLTLSSTQIALLTSLGLHFLLYKYGFPALLIQTNNISRQQTVSTIELSPFEQARLPDLDPEFAIPEFNNTPLDGAVPPLALPTYKDPELGDLTNLPPIPVPLLPDFSNLPSYSTDISLPPIGNLSYLPAPPSIEDLDLASLPEPPLTSVEELPETPETLPEEPETPVATNSPVTSPAKPEVEKPTPEQIAAVRQQKLQGTVSDISKSLQKQDVGNSDEDARKNYVSWISRIKEIEPEAIVLAGVYPKDACIRKLEGTSVYGVVVDSEHQIVSSELLKGASYPIFNQQAIKDIAAYDFSNETKNLETQDHKPYQVTVDYKYNAEICPSLTLPSLSQEDETETSQSEIPESTFTEPESDVPPTETVTPTEPETLKPATNLKLETPESSSADDSLKEKLQNIPLPDDNTIRERLRQTLLPEQQSSSSSSNDSLRERLQHTPLPDNDTIRERLRSSPSPEKGLRK